MSETIYESARRRLPDLEAEATALTKRLKAVKSEIADVRGLLKDAPQSQSTPEDVKSTPSARRKSWFPPRDDKPNPFEEFFAKGNETAPAPMNWRGEVENQDTIIAARIGAAGEAEGSGQ